MPSPTRSFRAIALLLALATISCDDDSSPAGPGVLPPTIDAFEITVAKNGTVSAVVPVVDPDGDPLTYALLNGPDHGTVTLVAAEGGALVTYTPFEGFDGTDALTFTASDGRTTAQGRVDITVVNTAPAAISGGTFERSAEDGSSVNVEVSATDPDGDPLTFAVVRGPVGGEVSTFAATAFEGEGPTTTTAVAVYTALPGFDEADDFEIIATDGTTTVGPVTVTVTVNEAPVATDVSASTDRGQPVVVELVGQDPDGDPLTFEVTSGTPAGVLSTTSGTLTPTTGGSTSGASAEVTFTPAAGFVGEATFEYVVRDDLDTSATGTATITVANQRPVVVDIQTTTEAGTPVEIELSGSDADGDPLTFELRNLPASGSVTAPQSTGPTTATVTYTPAADSRGTITFTYIARDGVGQSEPGRVEIELPPTVVALSVNRNSSSVSVIDVATNSVLGTIAVGSAPSAVAVSPDGATAYVTNQGDGSVSVIDIAARTVTRTIAVPGVPRDIVVSPDGATALVLSGFAEVTFVDLAAETVTATIPVFGFEHRAITISPDGTTAWLVSRFDEVVEIDVASRTVTDLTLVCCDLADVAYTPDGSAVWIAGALDLAEIDAATGTRSRIISLLGGGRAIAFTPDGTTAFVASFFDDRVHVVDVASGSTVGTIVVGVDPWSIVFSSDGATAYVVNRGDDTVSVIDVASRTVTDTVPVGDAPVAIAIGGAM